jgi:D-alanyl-lipoteichoic acid acyltransferase DltB (MBOAT superfamily)
MAVLFFSIQIYCDFSGYSDIALGSAKTMGFTLMTNFNRPFLYSTSITEFWRRWHISLYSWFNDYLYTPLAISFRNYAKWGIAAAVFITFSLSGLWHGANWTYVIWGGLHATALTYELFTKKIRKKISKKIPPHIYRFGSLVITFVVLNFIWIFFRADSISTAAIIIKHIFLLDHHVPFKIEYRNVGKGIAFERLSLIISLIMTIFLFISESKLKLDLSNMDNVPMIWNIVFCTFVLCMIILLGVFNSNSFIYFQF